MTDKEINKYFEIFTMNNSRELKSEYYRARLSPSQKVKLEKICNALDLTSSALLGVAIGMIYGYLVRIGKIKE